MLQNFSHMPQVSVISIIDILVVAFLIYEFLKLIKGTRAIPMLVAVVILAAPSGLRTSKQLKTVDWIITTLLPYAIFALIVVFGAEIRHALARLGRRLSAGRGGVFNGTDSYEDIVLAANHFSQTRDRRADRHRARDRLAHLHRKRRAAGRQSFLRPADYHLPSQRAAARRRGHRAEGPDRRRRLLPAAVDESCALDASTARAIAPPSASPKRRTRFRLWFRKRPAPSASRSAARLSATSRSEYLRERLERSAAPLRARGHAAHHDHRPRNGWRKSATVERLQPRERPGRRSGTLSHGRISANFFRKYVLKNLPFKLVSLAIAVMLWWAVGRDQPSRFR